MVAIKDMEMPKYCNDCDFVTDSFGYCNRAEEFIPNYEFFSETNEKPDFCPLVEIEKRKVGKWIEEPNCWLRCSCCNSHYPHTSIYAIKGSNYCPNCGADMRGSENE